MKVKGACRHISSNKGYFIKKDARADDESPDLEALKKKIRDLPTCCKAPSEFVCVACMVIANSRSNHTVSCHKHANQHSKHTTGHSLFLRVEDAVIDWHCGLCPAEICDSLSMADQEVLNTVHHGISSWKVDDHHQKEPVVVIEERVKKMSVKDHKEPKNHQAPVMPPGITNFGNSCYINSTLQSLATCLENESNIALRQHNTPGSVSTSLLSILDALTSSKTDTATVPKSTLNSLIWSIADSPFREESHLAVVIGDNEQEDAQEFLTTLLSMTELEHGSESLLRCSQYGEAHSKTESFTNISLWIEDEKLNEANSRYWTVKQPTTFNKACISLEQFISFWSQSCIISRETSESCKCSKKRKEGDSNGQFKQSLHLTELPKILVFHLMRFQIRHS